MRTRHPISRTPKRSGLLALVLLLLAPIAALAGDFPEPPQIDVPRDATPADAVTLYVQFATAEVTTAAGKTEKIWTRAYGLAPEDDLIPGPTFSFHPGSLLQITLDNLLGAENFEQVVEFESKVNPSFDTDEIAHGVGTEINIPHNPNNTNLHVHGLHVDPTQDDVKLIIIPKGDSKHNYDKSLLPVIREQIWPYQYRIPATHLPGTHWYHAHKHGSTSIHVENGMAGTLIIHPNDPERAIVPGLDAADDRVMVVQEIANYGNQQGQAVGTVFDKDTLGAAVPPNLPPGVKAPGPKKAKTLITVNGEVTPDLELRPGQLQRWRFVNAAANHKSFSYLWLAKKTGRQVKVRERATSSTTKPRTRVVTKEVYEEVPVFLVAIDGITLDAKVPITTSRPVFLGPGNRADILAQLDEGDYVFYKNYPTNIVVVDADGDCVLNLPAAGYSIADRRLPQAPNPAWDIANPYQLPQSAAGKPNFELFQQNWATVDQEGQPTGTPAQTTIAPSLRLKKVVREGAVLVDVEVVDTTFEGGFGWQPIAAPEIGGGGTDVQALFRVAVSGEPAGGPPMPDDDHLSAISPTGAMEDVPAYVSPIEDHEILQSRTALFDVSGVEVHVLSTTETTDGKPSLEQAIRQFTLNGRQFSLDDSIGNAEAEKLITKRPKLPTHHAAGEPKEGNVALVLDLVEPHNLWKNDYWTNPGYYRPAAKISGDSATPVFYYGDPVPLTYERLTGIPDVAVVNPAYAGHDQVAHIPGEPVATTAEEWILINNSQVGHPFHIHINPFFITEVGQLSYETFQGGQQAWVIRTINTDPDGEPECVDPRTGASTRCEAPKTARKLKGTSNLWWVPENWWDTIVIPPHGYVKLRYWMNVPQQSFDASRVEDNVNRFGNWVYHCHILRHEDRGMMMVVEAQPKAEKK